MKNYMSLHMDLKSKQLDFNQVVMTTEAKVLATKNLEDLIRKVHFAIKEAKMITNFWTNISSNVEDMGKQAMAATKYLSADEKRKKFDYLFEYLKSSFEDWKHIKEIAVQISNAFYENENE